MTWMNASVEAAPASSSGAEETTIHQAPKTRVELLDDAIAERLVGGGQRRGRPVARATSSALWWTSSSATGRHAAEHAAAVDRSECPSGAASRDAPAPPGRARAGSGRCSAHLDAELADTTTDAARADCSRSARASSTRPVVKRTSRARPGSACSTSAPTTPRASGGLRRRSSGGDGASAALADHLASDERRLRAPAAALGVAAGRARGPTRPRARPAGRREGGAPAGARARPAASGRCARAACGTRSCIATPRGSLRSSRRRRPLEGDPARAAALELDAACVARRRLGDAEGAVVLLERAASRVPIAPEVHSAHRRRAGRAPRGGGPDGGSAPRPAPAPHSPRRRAGSRAWSSAGSRRSRKLSATAPAPWPPWSAPRSSRPTTRPSSTSSIDASKPGGSPRSGSSCGRASRPPRRPDPSARDGSSGRRASRRARGASAKAVELARAAIVADPGERRGGRALARLARYVGAGGRAAGDDRADRGARPRCRARAGRSPAHRAPRGDRRSAGGVAGRRAGGDGDLRGHPARRARPSRGARRSRANGCAGRGRRIAWCEPCLREADETADAATADALRVRAAGDALFSRDPERSLALVRDVLSRTPGHDEARRLEQRLHEAAGRWAQVDAVARSAPRARRRRPRASRPVAGARRASAHALARAEGRHRVAPHGRRDRPAASGRPRGDRMAARGHR